MQSYLIFFILNFKMPNVRDITSKGNLKNMKMQKQFEVTRPENVSSLRKSKKITRVYHKINQLAHAFSKGMAYIMI